jgi:hypothetical protein
MCDPIPFPALLSLVGLLLLAGPVGAEPPAEDSSEFDTTIEFETGGEVMEAAGRFDLERKIGFVVVRNGSGEPWTSPIRPIWRLAAGDVDGDGDDELVYGMWSSKDHHGEEGRPKSIWVMGWQGRETEPLWRGSSLADPLVDFRVGDVDGDGTDEVFALEETDEGCLASVYRWSGFGLGRVAEQGVGCSVRLADGGACVVNDSGDERCMEFDQ